MEPCGSVCKAEENHVKHPSQPDTQPDEYLPEAPNAHKQRKLPADQAGVNPRDPSSMPRAEDDAQDAGRQS